MKRTAAIALLTVISPAALLAQANGRSPCDQPLSSVSTYAAVYFASKSFDELAKFDMVVLDPASYDSSDISKLKSRGCIPVAYMNIGEVETYRSYFNMVDTSMIISPDPYWRDRYYVDMCDPAWTRIVTKERIPDVMNKGFCGVFIDFAGALEEYPDIDSCAASLVRQIRRALGKGYLILDGGGSIIDRVGTYVDGIAVEGLMGYYDFNTDSYLLRNDSLEDSRSKALLAEAKKFRIKVFQLDYASPADSLVRGQIIIKSRQLGFVPYVGTIELDSIFTDTVHRIKLPNAGKRKPFPD